MLQKTVRCPRCGYDQRGAMAQWSDSCPMFGRCTECALDFRWAEVLHPEKFEPKWCIEFAPPGKWNLTKAAVKTWLMMLLPWKFWSRLKMSDPIRWRRIILFLVLVTLPVVGIYVVQQCAAAIVARHVHLEDANQGLRIARASVAYFALLDDQAAEGKLDTLEWQDFKRRHFWCVSDGQFQSQDAIDRVDDAAWIEHLNTVERRNSETIKRTQDASLPLATLLIDCLFRPRASHGMTSIAPAEVHSHTREYIESLQGRRDFEFASQAMEIGLVISVLSLLFFCFPLTLVLLPASRRRAKVRWKHIWRITAYSLSWPISIAGVIVLFYWSSVAIAFIDGEGLVDWGVIVGMLGPLLLLAATWLFALIRFLKIRHAFFVWLLHMILTLLILPIAALFPFIIDTILGRA